MTAGDRSGTQSQGDMLLWLGGALVVGMGVVWLVLAKPWADGSDSASRVDPAPTTAASAPRNRTGARAEVDTSLENNPLRMAELAYEAGMLTEPEDYSAWGLYRRALERAPDSADARRGLEKIAEELLKRATVAVEQGRFEDARQTIARIRTALPIHPGANELEFRIRELAPRSNGVDGMRISGPVIAPPSTARAAAPSQVENDATGVPASRAAVHGDSNIPEGIGREAGASAADPIAQAEDADAAPDTGIDPLDAPYNAFTDAVARNRLLTPAGRSAKHFLSELAAVNPVAPRTLEARRALFDALLDRGRRATADLDRDAAETWLEEAEALDVNTAAVTTARAALHRELIRIESARRVPISSLTVIEYIPPDYPARALERGLDGWVDVEFIVDTRGRPRDIEIIEASHGQMFRGEALAAVERWRFEPRVFLDQLIEQRAYSRIRFRLE